MIISLLTRPFSIAERAAKDLERRLNYVKYKIRGDIYKAWTCTFPIGGHQDIVGSFLRGAKAYLDVEVRVNPSRNGAEGGIVYVPSGWKALRDAVCLKRAGKIERLITGPVGNHLEDYDGLILDDAIDVCVVPCEWYKVQCEREAEEKKVRFDNIKVWPVGVDHMFWSPQDEKHDFHADDVLVYVKGCGAEALPQTEKVLEALGISYRKIFCGSHTPDIYKTMLEWCGLVIYLGYSETQGLALAQAWSMNRPTFVYEPDVVKVRGLDAAPYLTQETGMKWRCVEELERMLRNPHTFSPREWVLNNQTDAIAFGNFLKIVNDIK